MGIQNIDLIKNKVSDLNYKYQIKFYQGKYKINDEIVVLNNSTRLTFDEKPMIFEITNKRVLDYVIFHKDEDKEEIISIDEYNSIKNKIYNECFDYYDEYISLDAEYKYRKFQESYKFIYKDDFIETKLELKENNIFLLNTEDKYIVSDYFMGKNTPLCTFNIKSFAIYTFLEICQELNLKEKVNDKESSKTFVLPDHSGLRFAQVFNTYLFNDKKVSIDFWEFKYKRNGTFEDLLKVKNDIKNKIINTVQQEYNIRFNNVSIDKVDILKQLKIIQSNLNTLDVKVKSSNDKMFLEQKVRKLIENLYND